MARANQTTIRAAGAVLWRRTADGDREYALIHRPSYDDQSLPKGKIERQEIPIVAAAREIAEETGFRARIGGVIGEVSYRVKKTPKTVVYFEAEAVGGTFTPNEEVDTLEWVSATTLTKRLTYDTDREIVTRHLARPPASSTAILVRHARAGSKSRWRGDDRERPLDSVGLRQAAALVPVLDALGGTRVVSADRVRCVQTVQPWASTTGVVIERLRLLTEEGYAAHTQRARRHARDLALEPGGVSVMCSQGKVIPDLVQWWADTDGLKLERVRTRKGSLWILSFDEGRLIGADYLDSPLPHSM